MKRELIVKKVKIIELVNDRFNSEALITIAPESNARKK
jgi:hypothetical protein|tara:strand:- start:1304 stop:1417 length:114 start_codon:yes stop_codon:yes gene_type:complete